MTTLINSIFRSDRCCLEIVDDLINEWNKISSEPFRAVTFQSKDRYGNIIYHTDCMLTLLADHAIIAITCITNKKERKMMILELSNPPANLKPYIIVEIDRNEVEGMCANMFNLVDQKGQNCIIMSARAQRTYAPEKLAVLKENYKVLTANVDIIEHVGGGSTRCMLAERF